MFSQKKQGLWAFLAILLGLFSTPLSADWPPSWLPSHRIEDYATDNLVFSSCFDGTRAVFASRRTDISPIAMALGDYQIENDSWSTSWGSGNTGSGPAVDIDNDGRMGAYIWISPDKLSIKGYLIIDFNEDPIVTRNLSYSPDPSSTISQVSVSVSHDRTQLLVGRICNDGQDIIPTIYDVGSDSWTDFSAIATDTTDPGIKDSLTVCVDLGGNYEAAYHNHHLESDTVNLLYFIKGSSSSWVTNISEPGYTVKMVRGPGNGSATPVPSCTGVWPWGGKIILSVFNIGGETREEIGTADDRSDVPFDIACSTYVDTAFGASGILLATWVDGNQVKAASAQDIYFDYTNTPIATASGVTYVKGTINFISGKAIALFIDSSNAMKSVFYNGVLPWLTPVVPLPAGGTSPFIPYVMLQSLNDRGVALWSGSLYYAYTGEVSPINPPTHLRGEQFDIRYLKQSDWVNRLTWNAPTTGQVPTSYRIYRGSPTPADRIAEVVASGPLVYQDHNRIPGAPVTYWLSSVNGSNESAKVSIRIPGSGPVI